MRWFGGWKLQIRFVPPPPKPDPPHFVSVLDRMSRDYDTYRPHDFQVIDWKAVYRDSPTETPFRSMIDAMGGVASDPLSAETITELDTKLSKLGRQVEEDILFDKQPDP